ncbi:MAG: hypothetical protein NVS1B7_4910 [Candidatus Saccharimonadales bacterium]
MLGAEFPNEHPEYVDPATIELLRLENECRLEAKYQDDHHRFRADLSEKLYTADRNKTGVAWAMYYIDGPENNYNDQAEAKYHKEILLLTQFDDFSSATDELVLPTVRIITNEFIDTVGATPRTVPWLTHDITIDGDGDAWYFVDATTIDQAIDDNVLNYAPLFFVNDNGDLSVSCNALDDGMFKPTPIVDVLETSFPVVATAEQYTPFGEPTNIEDCIQALALARSVLAEIANTPAAARSRSV